MKCLQPFELKSLPIVRDLFNIYKIVMLRFISKPNAVRCIHRFFSDIDFVSRVLRFKLQDIESSQLNIDIKSLSSAESFLATQNKLFLQISGSLPPADLEAAKAAYIYRAAEVFSKPAAWGEAGESLRQFVAKMYASGSFTPELTRHFIEQTFVTLVRDGLHRDLSSMTMDVYVSILENCVLNDDVSSHEIQACTKYALEKLQFTQKKSKFIGRLVVAHALFLKKQKGRSTETDYGNALDSLLQLVNYTVKYLPNMPTQDILGSVLLMSHVNSCVEVFQGLSRMSVFATNWQLLDLEFQKTFRKNADFIDQHVKTAPEETLLAFLEEANSIANLYLPEQSKSILQSAVLERLESNSRNTTSNLVAMLISFCFKLDKNFEVSPKYLGALRVSTSDPVMQALQNASTNLDIFSKNQLADHLMIFIQELEVYLIRLMNGEEARESAHQAKLLAGIFKQLVALNRGNVNLFKAFFEYFSHQKVLDSIGLMPVLVQLLPALGIKTKKFGGAMTMNNSEDQMQNTMSLATTVSAEIKPSMKNVDYI